MFRTFHFIDIYFIFKECQRKESEKRRERSDIERLKLSIDKFVGAGLEDKGDYSKASTRLEFLEVQQG